VIILEVQLAWQGSPGEVTRQAIAMFRFVNAIAQSQIYWMCSIDKWQSH